MSTRVRITDPAKVPLSLRQYSLRVTWQEWQALHDAVVCALNHGLRSDWDHLLAGIEVLPFRDDADSVPDLDAIAAAFERGEQVPGAEMEDV